ncbi:MAG: MFS transporter [Planctomycetota bacterium]|jgi:DHA1 family inner membrane transport protein
MTTEAMGHVPQSGRMMLPALFFSRFITGIPGIISTLLLIEIGNSFGSSIGITGQISTASSILRFVVALIMGFLSVRYSHKTLLIGGLTLYVISALGCCVSVNLGMLMLSFTLTGAAFAIINPMTSTIVGENIPKEKRTTAMGWLIAGASTSYLLGTLIVSRIAGIGGWRLTFQGFMIPISILGIILAYFFIPKGESVENETSQMSAEPFRAVLFQRSAISCLFGTLFRMSAFTAILSYSVSFLRQQFLISRDFSSIVLTVMALTYTAGSLIAGRFVNKFGRKIVASFALALGSGLIIVFMSSSILWMSLITVITGLLFIGMSVSAGQSLNLEQVPEYRGTMMSLTSAFGGVGSALGAGVGGYLLLVTNWSIMAITFGLSGIIGATIMYLFAIDPLFRK